MDAANIAVTFFARLALSSLTTSDSSLICFSLSSPWLSMSK